MRKLIAILFLLTMAPLPAYASEEAEACFNKTIQSTEQRPSSAQLLVSIEHEGSQYHVIRESYDTPRVPDARVFLRTDSKGVCEEIMSYLIGSAPSEQVFRDKLGADVFVKIQREARTTKAR